MSEDWLDLGAGASSSDQAVAPPGEVGASAHGSGHLGNPGVPAPLQPVIDPRAYKIARLKRKLSLPMREYAYALVASRGNIREAEAAMKAAGVDLSASRFAQWRQNCYLQELVSLMQERAVEAAGITATKVLMQADAIADYGAEMIDKRDKYGNRIVENDTGAPVKVMRDPDLALKAVELLGKKFKMWGNDDDRRVVVNIVDLTGQERARVEPLIVEGEAEDVSTSP